MTKTVDEAPMFALFWESSKLNRRTAQGFAARLDSDGRIPGVAPQLHFANAALPLPKVPGALGNLQSQRRSDRNFGSRPLTPQELGALLGAVGERDGHRLSPSAGGTYPLETFVLPFRADPPFGGHVLYLDPAQHRVIPVAPLPSWPSLAEAVGLPDLEQGPAAVVLFVGIAGRVVRRYGERGGRFLLLEAGHLAQNLLLAAAELGLAAVPLGGLYDDPLRALVGLPDADAQVVYGVAVGASAESSPARGHSPSPTSDTR